MQILQSHLSIIMPPTVLDKVCTAIETLAEPGGASRVAIAKAVKAASGEVSAVHLKKALASGVAKGRLVQTGQRFALVGVAVACFLDQHQLSRYAAWDPPSGSL